jgi:signal transduction histidine kinase
MLVTPVARSRAALAVARLLAFVAAAAAALAVALPLLTGGDWLADLFRTPEPVLAPSFAAAGALLVGTPAARRLGWLLVAVGLSAGGYVLATSWAYLDGSGPATWLRGWLWIPALLLVTGLLPQVLPDGRPLPGWWRVPAAAAVLLTVVTTLAVAVPGGPDDPFAVPGFPVALAVLVVAAVASLVVRVRRADAVVRRQLAWVAYALVAAIVATFLAPWWLVALAVLLVPGSIVVAALRYRLFVIDLIVDRTLVGGVLLAGTAVVYAAVVAWAGALLGERRGSAPFLAAFAVALAFHPAQTRVRRAVDRLLHGDRADPLALLTHIDRALAAAADPRQALREGVAVAVARVRLRGLCVRVDLPDGGTVVERSGEVAGQDQRDGDESAAPGAVPLVLHGQRVGTLLVVPRAGPAGPEPLDDRLLAGLAGRLAAAAYAVRLSRDVEESRERLLTAREEERRRLRRDLHDGLGPQLSAVVMTLDTAASALRRDDGERALALVGTAAGHARDAVTDVRRLVHGLRPPALDDLGLLGALQATAAGVSEGGPDVVVEGAGDIASLPAALEVAVLRIAQEALVNAVRHAGASRIHVAVRAGGDVVELEVADDGHGLHAGRTAGVGLASMRERAAELGGSCSVGPGRRGGTRVHAVIPRPVLS